MKNILNFILLVFGVTQSFSQAMAHENLKSYNIDKSAVTISGISSGAFMANQMSIAYSKTFSGSASIAGGIYWCAQGSSQRAQGECMSSTANIHSEVQIAQAQKLAQAGEIDPLENLAKQKLYIFASPKDSVIKPPSSDKLYEFSKKFIPENQIKYETSVQSGHGFPTLNYGAMCNIGFLPWLLKCNFDGAGETLKAMYSDLKERGTMKAENLLTYNQSEFGPESTPLFASAWVYVPTACQNGEKCKLHVALHGCQMNPDFIQDQFAKNAGYNEWAEANNIVVLYPQSAKLGQSNPYACWDWYGFTGENYVTQSGAQMKILKAMIDRLTK